MAQSLDSQGYGAARAELNDIGAQRVEFASAAELDALQLAIGAGGIIDPSPTADLTNAGISLARGDYFGFVLDGVSAVPYAGDLVSKPFRGIQMGIRSWSRGRKVAGLARRGAALVDNIRSMRQNAAEAVKAARRRVCGPRCNNAYGTTTPTRGTWGNPADPGNGSYSFGGNNYQFRDGYPDFDHDDMAGYLHPSGQNRASIEMTGNRATDDRLANAVAGFDETPDDFTWHHGDDGTTMYLVSTPVHQATVPHTGGHNIAADPLF